MVPVFLSADLYVFFFRPFQPEAFSGDDGRVDYRYCTQLRQQDAARGPVQNIELNIDAGHGGVQQQAFQRQAEGPYVRDIIVDPLTREQGFTRIQYLIHDFAVMV